MLITEEYNILIMELLGRSLEDILNSKKPKTFSIKTTCNLATQILKILEYIHNLHIIHRDIKPDNFVMGVEDKNSTVYLIDFGLSKKYRSSRTLIHNPFTCKKKLTGTARYASINALQGYEQSRRDDLESLGYVLLYFLKGNLPWQGLPVRNGEDRYQKIMEKKRDTSSKELCLNYPKQFEIYLEYTKNLKYEEDPDYEYLRNLFSEACKENSLGDIDKNFDWDNDKSTNDNSRKIEFKENSLNAKEKNKNEGYVVNVLSTEENQNLNKKNINLNRNTSDPNNLFSFKGNTKKMLSAVEKVSNQAICHQSSVNVQNNVDKNENNSDLGIELKNEEKERCCCIIY
ncbi:MAG: casein kinase 1 family protein [archaeon]|nr:casein kinase 1 family protein [archaeon]